MRLRNAFKYSVFEASKSVSTKTPLLKHYYRRQGQIRHGLHFTVLGGRKTAQEKKTNSWERRFPGTFRTNVPLILPIFSVFSVGGGPKSSQELCSWELFFLILGGFSLCTSRFTRPRFMCFFCPLVLIVSRALSGKLLVGGERTAEKEEKDQPRKQF